MKFIPVGNDLGNIKAFQSKFKEDSQNEDIVVLGHTDNTRKLIGGKDAKALVKHIIKEAGGEKSKIKNVHLFACEAGFVNEQGESLAQAIANEFQKQGCKNVVVHAISNKNQDNEFVEYAGMRVEVVGESSTLHRRYEKIEDGYVRGYAYKTEEALKLEDELSKLPEEIQKKDIIVQKMPEYIGNSTTKNPDKAQVRIELQNLRQRELKLINEREKLVEEGSIVTLVGTNNPYEEICQNKAYEFRFGDSMPKPVNPIVLKQSPVKNDNHQDVLPGAAEEMIKEIKHYIENSKKYVNELKEFISQLKQSGQHDGWKNVLENMTRERIEKSDAPADSTLCKLLIRHCAKNGIVLDNIKTLYDGELKQPVEKLIKKYNKKYGKQAEKEEKEDLKEDTSSQSSHDSESIQALKQEPKKKEGNFLKRIVKKFIGNEEANEEHSQNNPKPVQVTLSDHLTVTESESNNPINYQLKNMAKMIGTFSLDEYKKVRVEGQSSEAKWKKRWTCFFGKKEEERKEQIKALHSLAQTVTTIYERKQPLTLNDQHELNEAGKALIAKVNEIYGDLTKKQKKYFKQSNLLTNLEVVLLKTKDGHQPARAMNLEDENITKQLMFKDQLNGIKQEGEENSENIQGIDVSNN